MGRRQHSELTIVKDVEAHSVLECKLHCESQREALYIDSKASVQQIQHEAAWLISEATEVARRHMELPESAHAAR